MANLTPSRILSLSVLTAVCACGLVLDLPNPTLDPTLGAGGPDGGGDGDVVVPENEGGSPDAGADAPARCDLTLPENCGACGVDCSGGDCTNGICLLADQFKGGTLYAPEGITIMGDKLYVAITGEPPAIGSCPLAGCRKGASVTPVLEYDGGTYHEPEAITNDGTSLFWVSYSGDPTSGVYRTETNGTTVQLNAQAPEHDYGTAVAVSGGNVFWTNAYDPGGGFVCNKSTGCGATLTPVDNTNTDHTRYGRDVIATQLGPVWGINGDIVHCPTDDCSTGVRTICNGWNALSTDGRNVYFGTYEGDIARAALDADVTAREIIVTGDTLNDKEGPSSTLVVGTMLYWTVSGDEPDAGNVTTNGFVQKCTLPSCKDITTIADKQAAPRSLATDGKAIYWVNAGKVNHFGSPGSIQKTPL